MGAYLEVGAFLGYYSTRQTNSLQIKLNYLKLELRGPYRDGSSWQRG
jgi:hypothetical protein